MLSAGLLIAFGGITDNLIPLFAVGAFLAFTMSQAGMVEHWRKVGGEHSEGDGDQRRGAVCTAVTLVVVLVSKFAEGAWIMLILLIPVADLVGDVQRGPPAFISLDGCETKSPRTPTCR